MTEPDYPVDSEKTKKRRREYTPKFDWAWRPQSEYPEMGELHNRDKNTPIAYVGHDINKWGIEVHYVLWEDPAAYRLVQALPDILRCFQGLVKELDGDSYGMNPMTTKALTLAKDMLYQTDLELVDCRNAQLKKSHEGTNGN